MDQMTDIQTLVSRIELRVRQWQNQRKDNLIEIEALKARCEDLNKIIENQQNKINELEKTVNVLRISGGLSNDSSSVEVKQSIQEMIRNIDKCMKILERA